jgi:hypothetical protein
MFPFIHNLTYNHRRVWHKIREMLYVITTWKCANITAAATTNKTTITSTTTTNSTTAITADLLLQS